MISKYFEKNWTRYGKLSDIFQIFFLLKLCKYPGRNPDNALTIFSLKINVFSVKSHFFNLVRPSVGKVRTHQAHNNLKPGNLPIESVWQDHLSNGQITNGNKKCQRFIDYIKNYAIASEVPLKPATTNPRQGKLQSHNCNFWVRIIFAYFIWYFT